MEENKGLSDPLYGWGLEWRAGNVDAMHFEVRKKYIKNYIDKEREE
ncbi:hypothetical protein [Flammeovirga pacifica]|nr:hypothetical protein [Flammeovirga pacifica]